MAPPAPRETSGQGARLAGLYGGVIGTAAVTLLVVLGLARGIDPTPQLPMLLRTSPASASCLGTTLVALQSGVFLELHVPGSSAVVGGEEGIGERIGQGRVDRRSRTVAISGTCAPGTVLAAHRFDAQITMQPGDGLRTGATLATGVLRVDGRSPVVLEFRSGEAASEQDGLTTTKRLSNDNVVTRVLLAVATICAAALLLGHLFKRIGQPHVLGEIVAGVALGPSVLGALSPTTAGYLFPAEVIGVLRVMAQFGLVLFMFLVGLRLNLRLARGLGREAVLISHVSIAFPFASGAIVAILLYPWLGSGSFVGFALFMGAAMAITAFPVLARILTETGFDQRRIGVLSITCAAVDDVTAWCLLAVVTAVVRSRGWPDVASTILLSAAFGAVMVLQVRPWLARRFSTRYRSDTRLPPDLIGGLLVGLFLVAWLTETIGLNAIFGAFLVGVVMPRSHKGVSELVDKLEDMTTLFLLPLFFAIVGLETRIGLTTQPAVWWGLAIVILATAVIGKWGSSTLAARALGFGWRDANALGILLNTRGLTEIVVLTIGRSLGVVSSGLFTMMVLMTLVTTLMATPLIKAMYRGRPLPEVSDPRTG
ncbi:MAG: cation:proton antiporter [Egibacteraceae bacterium]